MIQMIIGLITVGLVAKIVLGASRDGESAAGRTSRRRRPTIKPGAGERDPSRHCRRS